MRFAAHRPGNPWPFPRGHGMSCRRPDVASGGHAGVGGVSTGSAAEGGLALARLGIHDPARRASPARVRGADLDHPAGGLVFEPLDQASPTGRENRSVERRLGVDVAAGPGARAPSRSGHAPGPAKVRHGLGEVLLPHDDGARPQPGELRPSLGRPAAPLGETRRALAARPPMAALLNRQIPDEPGMLAVFHQRRLPDGRGVEPVAGHADQPTDHHRQNQEAGMPGGASPSGAEERRVRAGDMVRPR
ncbi:hypothetical protein SAMN05444920_105526 [Nonomuraea solani]|uniref:Uncharacterized protein n=1 Tax=Nonomuraea solani TaxID=1144553 RepID=A0A1H6DIX0_9ACTN|nr:hypothetical protein SAMN05444920_105526 [Nonomuraea solani]